jgi:hypothetical protein
MLELLHALAARLRPLEPVALMVLAAGLIGFVWAVVTGAPDRWLSAALLAAVWGGWCFTWLAVFAGPPPGAPKSGSLRARLRYRLSRAGYLTLAWLLLGSGAAAAFLSVRLLGLEPSP